MLFLMFQLGRDRYVLDTGQVAAVLPLLATKQLPGAPAGVAGAISYRGRPVPVVDLALLALGRPAEPRLSTRIILLRYPSGPGSDDLLGLLVEQAVETIERDQADFATSGVEAGMPPYLGPVASDERGLIQWVRGEALLTPEIRDILFRRQAAEP